jgi:hypothetical protein
MGDSEEQKIEHSELEAGGKKTVVAVLAVVAVLVVAQLVVTSLLYLAVLGLESGTEDEAPFGSFASLEPTSPTEATITFSRLSNDPEPMHLSITLGNGIQSGTYVFPSNDDGVTLSLIGGDNVGTITYQDFAQNGKVNLGDRLVLTELTPGSNYGILMFWDPTGEILDAQSFSTPEIDTSVPAGSFVWVSGVTDVTAEAVFGKLSNDPAPMNLKIILEHGPDSGIYVFPGNSDGVWLNLDSGVDIGNIRYQDLVDNGKVNLGDYLEISDLDPLSDYTIRMIWAPTGDQIDFETFSTTHPTDVVPTGQWGPYDERSNTEVWVEFARVTPEPRPTQLEIVLVRNGTDQGLYSFQTDNDGPLALASGVDVGTLTYEDYIDNERVNTGDELRMTNLSPGSDYTLMMFWGPTGDMIATKDFSTSN